MLVFFSEILMFFICRFPVPGCSFFLIHLFSGESSTLRCTRLHRHSSRSPLPQPCFHVQAGFEPASFRSSRMCSYHWATGTSTLTLLFFGVLSFLIGQNQLNFCKSEIWTQVSHTKVQRSDRWATGVVFFFFFLDLCLFGGWGFMFTSYWSFVFLLKCYSFMSKPLATNQQRCSTSLEHILLRSNVCWFCLHVNWTHDLEIVSHVLSGELHEVE